MSKQRTIDHEIHPLLKERWSPRAFADRAVDESILLRVFEAARWAPSCFNEQPVRFIIGRKGIGDNHRKMFEILSPGNQIWAGAAPVLGLVCGKKSFTHNDLPNHWHAYDAGQAAAHFTFQAQSEGLFVHQMGGFDPARAVELFGIPPDFQPVAALALGYLGDPDSLPDNLKRQELAPGRRRALPGTVFEGDWGEPARFLP